MKFKTNQEEQSNEQGKMSLSLYKGFIDLIQFEIDKLALISSAKFYFCENGLINNKKFFKTLYKSCEEIKHCLIEQLIKNSAAVPEFTIPGIISFDDTVTPFKMLSDMEDTFESKLISLIDIAFGDKDWYNFHYLLKKLDTIDHICCRALAAVKNNADVLTLCEQHTLEK